MIEYFNNPKATEEFFYINENGERWSKTGDIGYMNEDGSLVVLGRKSDFSIIDGVQIYNFDIERAILTSDKVKLCEIQTHPADKNRLVAHIVWENEVASSLRQTPEKQLECFAEIQKNVMDYIHLPEAIPHSFCVRDHFPSAHSGKRDVQFIKNNTDGLIEI